MSVERCRRPGTRDQAVMIDVKENQAYRYAGSICRSCSYLAGSSVVGVGKTGRRWILVLLPAALNEWRRWWRLGVEIRQKFSDGEREKAGFSANL